MQFVKCSECHSDVDLESDIRYSPNRGVDIYHAPCFIRRIESELARAQAALRKLMNEPMQCMKTVTYGPYLDERPTGDWVCVHCGEYGDSETTIEHAEDCGYAFAIAALDAK